MQISPEKIKVVIVGQDPYASPDVATGLAFAIDEDNPVVQPSLSIIQTELAVSYYNDIAWYLNNNNLEDWEKQGVLLLNCSLSCEEYIPESEEQLWKPDTHSFLWRVCLMESLFNWLSTECENLVFVFMGKKAQYYAKYIDNERHQVFEVAHPVADYRSGGKLGEQKFIGSKIFNKINEALKLYGKDEIKW